MRALRILVALASVGAFFALASSALASTTHSTYGQCGPAVHNGSQLLDAWGAQGVLNSPTASSIVKSAGWNPMDGSMVSYVSQRGREFSLAQPADIEDFGCQHGKMYSVGNRHYGAGEKIIGIVPPQYDPAQISGTSRKGWVRITIWVHTVGRGSCANGFRKLVLVYAYVPKHKAKPAPKPAPKPKPGTVQIWIRKQAFSAASEEQLINPTPTNVFRFRWRCGAKGKDHYTVYQSDPQYAGTCKTGAGRLLIWEMSTLGPDKWQNLSPVYQTFKLKGKKKVLAVYKDKQVKQPVATPPVCTDTNANNYGKPLPCTYNSPPPSAPPTYSCTGLALSTTNLAATATISVSTTGGASFKSASINWGDNGTTSGGLVQQHTYGSAGNYSVNATVTFNLPNSTTATATCSGAVSISTPPPVVSPPSVSVNFVQEIDASTGSVTYTARVCGAVKSQNGHTLSVSFRANYGHFDSPNLPLMTANGSDQQVCNTYTSPTEAGVKDQITIVVLDTTSGLNASNVSNQFDIVVASTNPS